MDNPEKVFLDMRLKTLYAPTIKAFKAHIPFKTSKI